MQVEKKNSRPADSTEAALKRTLHGASGQELPVRRVKENKGRRWWERERENTMHLYEYIAHKKEAIEQMHCISNK